jgi:hypothetical protein
MRFFSDSDSLSTVCERDVKPALHRMLNDKGGGGAHHEDEVNTRFSVIYVQEQRRMIRRAFIVFSRVVIVGHVQFHLSEVLIQKHDDPAYSSEVWIRIMLSIVRVWMCV